MSPAPDVPPESPSEVVIGLRKLSVTLGGRRVLNGLDGELKGSIVGLLGPNGAGKTTLLRTLLGFFRASSGDALVLGRSLWGADREIRGLLGYMPEHDAHIAGMTAIRWVRYLGELSGLPPDVALERGHEALTYVGLGEARYRKVGTFSTGMKQLAKLAQALVHGPRLLLLDEPTNGMDPAARVRFLDLVKEIGTKGETRILVSSHLLGDIERVCDEVVILKKGFLVATCDLRSDRLQDRRLVQLELTAGSADFLADLRKRGFPIEAQSTTRLQVELADDGSVQEIFAAAHAAGIGLRRVLQRRDSLQEVFLRAIEGDHGGS